MSRPPRLPSGSTPALRRHRRWPALLAAGALLLASQASQAFCGFYVGKADASLFNEASRVILARDGERTVISMLNDYRGDLAEFALVVPVPQVLRRDQIRVADAAVFDRLDAYSAPRLAEYHDPDPCARNELRYKSLQMAPSAAAMADSRGGAARATGVTVEARYAIGEYDIAILSATQSDGLQRWLLDNGYRLPAGAAGALAPYVRQAMKFFVARVNLGEQARLARAGGFTRLRPLQFTFDSPRFMLPMRLGMLNAQGPQDLIVYALTRRGRVESSNYRTIRLPANMELPAIVRTDFARFYKTMFERQAQREQHRVVFTEYVWDTGWCDPCAADPLSQQELREAGVFWLDGAAAAGKPAPATMLTRLHLRYTADSFPEDLMFQQTGDRENFQARYLLRQPFTGDTSACEAGRLYEQELVRRRQRDARTLHELTGWTPDPAGSPNAGAPAPRSWWQGLWQG